MSAYHCERCWFRKTSTGSETHLEWEARINEGDCIITKAQCNQKWEGYGEIVQCPVLRAFYAGKKPKPKKEKKDYEQLSLF